MGLGRMTATPPEKHPNEPHYSKLGNVLSSASECGDQHAQSVISTSSAHDLHNSFSKRDQRTVSTSPAHDLSLNRKACEQHAQSVISKRPAHDLSKKSKFVSKHDSIIGTNA